MQKHLALASAMVAGLWMGCGVAIDDQPGAGARAGYSPQGSGIGGMADTGELGRRLSGRIQVVERTSTPAFERVVSRGCGGAVVEQLLPPPPMAVRLTVSGGMLLTTALRPRGDALIRDVRVLAGGSCSAAPSQCDVSDEVRFIVGRLSGTTVQIISQARRNWPVGLGPDDWVVPIPSGLASADAGQADWSLLWRREQVWLEVSPSVARSCVESCSCP